METIQISEIKINERFRKTVGSLSSLVESIKEVGLLHPVVVSEKNELIAGWRRIKAFELLGRTEIPCNRINIADLRKGEVQENMRRKDFTVSELVAIRRALEPEAKEEAKERQGTRTDLGQHCGNLPRSRDVVASYGGVSGRTLDKAEKIVEAAEKEPERFKPLLAKVDNGKTSIQYAYKMVKRADVQAHTPPLPKGQFDVIYADPPWQYDLALRGSPDEHYSVMETKDIMLLLNPFDDVPAAKNSVLFLWATNPKLEDALKVMGSWGFTYKTNLVWVKNKFGTGYYFRGQHELLLLGVKGSPPVPMEQDRPSSILNADRQEHSEKPQEIYSTIERMYPHGKYLELFARQKRDRWVSWGLQIT